MSEEAVVVYVACAATGVILIWIRGLAMLNISKTLGPLLLTLRQLAADVARFAIFQVRSCQSCDWGDISLVLDVH